MESGRRSVSAPSSLDIAETDDQTKRNETGSSRHGEFGRLSRLAGIVSTIEQAKVDGERTISKLASSHLGKGGRNLTGGEERPAAAAQIPYPIEAP